MKIKRNSKIKKTENYKIVKQIENQMIQQNISDKKTHEVII